jgi:sugar phosphate isomerase/epimerase
MFDDIIKSVQVCIPFRLLREKHLPLVIENRINPEIGIDGDTIDTYSEKDFSDMAFLLRQEGLSVTLHGPFFDLAPGGMDKKILKASRERLRQAFDIVPLFEPKSIVCHTGYDRKRYRESQKQWLETTVETWAPLVEDLRDTATILTIENVYEKTPTMLVRLFDALDNDKVGFCFDTGHMHAFSDTDMESWLDALGPFLKQLHLHDNDGTWDDHWAIGSGKVNFDMLFRHVEEHRLHPIITLEAHQEDWLWQSLENLSHSVLFRRLLRQ